MSFQVVFFRKSFTTYFTNKRSFSSMSLYISCQAIFLRKYLITHLASIWNLTKVYQWKVYVLIYHRGFFACATDEEIILVIHRHSQEVFLDSLQNSCWNISSSVLESIILRNCHSRRFQEFSLLRQKIKI